MPWWLLGTSMVATTFATDTPNLVAGIVRRDGVMGNWVWWAFLLTGSTTVFLFAKLWRRSNVLTDIEFYELRYSGKPAAFLRGFRAVYLGVFFNVIIMANVTLAAIKIGGVLLGLTPMQSILIASVITVSYSMVGGLTGVLLTDLVQFVVAMVGSVWAAHFIVGLPEVAHVDEWAGLELVDVQVAVGISPGEGGAVNEVEALLQASCAASRQAIGLSQARRGGEGATPGQHRGGKAKAEQAAEAKLHGRRPSRLANENGVAVLVAWAKDGLVEQKVKIRKN
jgi:hypothetical protein